MQQFLSGLLLLLFFPLIAFSNPKAELILSPVPDSSSYLQAGNIRTQFWNKGIWNRGIEGANSPGFEWPKGSNKYAIFTTGLNVAGYISGALKMVAASFEGEWVPGYSENGVFHTDSRFKLYNVKRGDNFTNSESYANWHVMVPFGAPYDDINSNGIYDTGIDIPGVANADQTIFICLTDGDPSEHNSTEGFGGGTLPMFAQLAITGWSYNLIYLENAQFIKLDLINKNTNSWDSVYYGVYSDPDLGDAVDDWTGCDTTLEMYYCYNSDNMDGSGSGNSYGLNPPAVGMDIFCSTRDSNDFSSFLTIKSPSGVGASCDTDPHNVFEAYTMLKGFKRDGSYHLNPTFNPPLKTKYTFSGDPESGIGWTEADGKILNCNGKDTGTVQPSPGGNRYALFSSGSKFDPIHPNDTVTQIIGQFIARGSNNLNSVTKLKEYSKYLQRFVDNGFDLTPPAPPVPQVDANYQPGSETGAAKINLSWDGEAEFYNFTDTTLFQTNYKFQGYEIYELSRLNTALPDFYEKVQTNSQLKMIRIFDIADSVGTIVDTIVAGFNGLDPVLTPYIAVPPEGLPVPNGFPNAGLQRNITLETTQYPEEHGGQSKFVYGQQYKFLVTAYAYSSNGPRGYKVVRSYNVVTIIPEAPVAGTQWELSLNDTLNTSRRDLGVIPIVRFQDSLKSAKYKVIFGNPDTSYSIVRSLDGGNFFDTLYRNAPIESGGRIVDGLEVNVKRIRGNALNSHSNVGVIKDPVLPTDSIQTRQYGWSYYPEQNRNLEGSKYDRGRKMQSVSMGISWLTTGTFSNLRSLVTKEMLRKVEFRFTSETAGQQAYLYADTSKSNDNSLIFQNMVQVPFTLWEVESNDTTPVPRQLNCAIVVSRDTGFGINPNLTGFQPQADSLGSKLLVYIFYSDYDPNPNAFYTSKNLFLSTNIDIMYVWALKLISSGAAYTIGDTFTIYPYTVTRPFTSGDVPLIYEFETPASIIGSNEIAINNNDIEFVRAVPNPYYASLLYSTSNVITFRRMPVRATIKIYTLNGDLIKKIEKDNFEPTAQWDVKNFEGKDIASGMYIALIDSPIGQKIIKLAVFKE